MSCPYCLREGETTDERTENGGRGHDTAYYRWVYENAGWEVLDGHSQGWKL